jgi:hypothetical protein
MSGRSVLPLVVLFVALSGCGSGGNLSNDNRHHGSARKPVVVNKFFDPYAKPGSNPVIWAAPTWDRNGTIVAPRDPSLQWNWEPYEAAPWRRPGKEPGAPEGTF